MQTPSQTGGQREAMKNVAQLALWTLAWLGTLALATFGPEYLWDSELASWAAVAANLAVGVGLIVAHARYLQGIDELQRKIQLNAMALTLGVGYVGGFAYVVADAADIVGYDAEIGVLITLTAVAYMIAIAAGNIRYR